MSERPHNMPASRLRSLADEIDAEAADTGAEMVTIEIAGGKVWTICLKCMTALIRKAAIQVETEGR